MKRTDTDRRTDISTAQNCKTAPPVRLNSVSLFIDHFFLERRSWSCYKKMRWSQTPWNVGT
jgi:hypothetical protein